jgi:uncharacterized protein YodC (DUF2158 family)
MLNPTIVTSWPIALASAYHYISHNEMEKAMATWTPKFKVGATVTLNTGGGPVMSVKIVPSEQGRNYSCQWFAGRKLDQGEFKEEQLIAAAPKAPLSPPDNEKT